MIWKCANFEFDIFKPILMGILNVTPDSFSDGGLHDAPADALAHAQRLVDEGAHIIDVGGESTRPGAEEVSEEEELARVLIVVRELSEQGIAVSIDTRHASVARACVDAGACIINDVSGFRSPDMREVAQHSSAGLVIMHMLGEPRHMQENPHYDDVVASVDGELVRMARRLEHEGVSADRICLDPGVGFGKRPEHNQALIEATPRLAANGYALMVAVSRKSYIYAYGAGVQEPSERDEDSALCAAFACAQGARIARVHNVALTKDILENSRRAIVALGSNQGNCAQHLDAALAALRAHEHVWVSAVSAYVESEPAYLQDQSHFVNAVALLQTTLSPDELLAVLLEIEQQEGRVRTVENGPRTLDLDIVDYEGVVSDAPELTLPHPLALERDFVVTPLLSLLPHAVLADGRQVTGEGVTVGKVIGTAGDCITCR